MDLIPRLRDQAFFKNPHIKIVLIFLGIILIYLAIGSWINKVKVSEEKVLNAWDVLEQHCNSRLAMIPQFIQLIQSSLPENATIVQPLVEIDEKARKSSPINRTFKDSDQAQAFIALQKEIVEELKKMEEKISPTFSQNQQYTILKLQLERIEQQILLSASLLNQEIEIFNYHISGFPREIANDILLQKKKKNSIQIATLTQASTN